MNGWRLPTEAEWEYLDRGASLIDSEQKKYSGTDDATDIWNGTVYQPTDQITLHNSLGLYAMTGNVWEWCWDYEGTITATVPEHGPTSGTNRRNVRGSGIEFLNERHGMVLNIVITVQVSVLFVWQQNRIATSPVGSSQ